ncbi:hypothetical protein [Aquibium microcysteis]|uniref:hypothetical protein n=1 Tax=Aquibium microcysteis TaxID=675281 RepID=UPI00165D2269|nr:hypothetical protein [Aquibium microcysteis]
MTLHVRQSDRSRARPAQWTPWGAMPATREPVRNRTLADKAAARPQAPRLSAIRPSRGEGSCSGN